MPMIFRKPQRKTVAVDLDQTLAHTLEAMVLWHNEVYNTSFTFADFDTYDFHKVWGGSMEEACVKVREFYDSPHFEQIQPIHDFALEALKMLKKRKFSLVIITSRQQFIAEDTKKFVDKHYPGIFESIYFCNLGLTDQEQMEYVSKPKSAICQEIGADVLIDDNLEHAVDCAGLDIQVLLYDRKGQYRWNHTKTRKVASTLTSMSRQLYHNHHHAPLPANVTRVSSWKEIIAFFPKPHSPLRNCYYPQDLAAYDEEDTHQDEYGIEYETVEVEMTDDEDEYDIDDSDDDYMGSKKRSSSGSYYRDEDEMVWV
ncbi:hypothetical protein BJV82DRAFT_602866 [Fennellomyces sp. T-0311]|nr:hypothetical protein BJV82DRAFT_602866 [Fennellomyces sp. T-0311]